MRSKLIVFLFLITAVFSSCRNEQATDDASLEWLKPSAGGYVNLGDSLILHVRSPQAVDSVVYFLDEQRLGSAADTLALKVATTGLTLGMKSLMARSYSNNELVGEIGTSVVIKSALTPRKLSYTVNRTFAHDTSSYTQGLEYHQGFLYESDGETGQSSIRKVDPSNGRVLMMTPMGKETFAEGITILGNKILMLTYVENKLHEYELSTLKLLREFPAQYIRQGWGLTNDGSRIYNTDGSNRVYILNKDTYMQEGFIEVYDHRGPVESLNELEFIDGMIYANIYESYRIVVIDPKTGQVTAELDMSELYPDSVRPMKDADMLVFNGIAWDKARGRMYVTGKKWDKMFEISIR